MVGRWWSDEREWRVVVGWRQEVVGRWREDWFTRIHV